MDSRPESEVAVSRVAIRDTNITGDSQRNSSTSGWRNTSVIAARVVTTTPDPSILIAGATERICAKASCGDRVSTSPAPLKVVPWWASTCCSAIVANLSG